MEHENQWDSIRNEIIESTAGIDPEKLVIFPTNVETKPDGSKVIEFQILEI